VTSPCPFSAMAQAQVGPRNPSRGAVFVLDDFARRKGLSLRGRSRDERVEVAGADKP
jgi:hypothetical protein